MLPIKDGGLHFYFLEEKTLVIITIFWEYEKLCFFFFLQEHTARLVSIPIKIKEGGESSRNTKELFLKLIRVVKLQLEKCNFNI